MVKLAQTATSSDTGNDSITKTSATLLEMSSATSRIPQPIAMPIPLPAQISSRTATPTPMCVTMPVVTTSVATPTTTITVNKNYHVPRGPAFVANMSTSSRSAVAAPIRAPTIGTAAAQVIRTVVPNRSNNSSTPLVLQAPVQWQKVRTPTANVSSLSNSLSVSNTTITSAAPFLSKPITVTASSVGHSQIPTRTQILTKNTIFTSQSPNSKTGTTIAVSAATISTTATAATPAKALTALVSPATTTGSVVVVTASSSSSSSSSSTAAATAATVTMAPNYLPTVNTQIRSLSTISLSPANSTNASKTHAVIHNSGNNSSSSNFTASRLLHTTNSAITKSAFQNMSPKPLTLTTLNSGKITIAPVQASQQSQQPKLPANTTITVTGAPNARVTFSNPQNNILTRIANTVPNSKASNSSNSNSSSSTTSNAVVGNPGVGRLSTGVLQLQNVIVSTAQGVPRSNQNAAKVPFPTLPITSGSASIQISHLNKQFSNSTASTPIPVTVNMSASGQKIVQLDKTIGSTTITPLPFDQNNKNVNYSANILSQVIQSKVASSNQKPLTILNSQINSAATGSVRLSQGGHVSSAESLVKLPKISMPNTSIVLSSVAKQLNNVTVTSVSAVTTTKAVATPTSTHPASSAIASNLISLANNDDITITVNKVTTSPRPTILRKRDSEGSFLRAAKNLSSIITGSSSQNQTFETYAVNSNNNTNSINANHNSNSGSSNSSSSNSCSSTCISSTGTSCSSSGGSTLNSRSSAATDNEISPSNSSPDYFHEEIKLIEDDRSYDASPRKKRRKQQLAISGGDSVESKLKCDELQFMINKPKAPVPVNRIQNGIGIGLVTGSGTGTSISSNHHSKNNSSVNNNDAMQTEDEQLSSESETVVPKRQQVSLLNCYQQSWKPTNNHFIKPTDVRPKIDRKITIIDIANQSHITKKINGWRISYISSEINEIKKIEHSVNDRIYNTLILESLKDKRYEKKICKIIELAKGNYQRCNIIKDCLQSSEDKLQSIFNHKGSINDIISRCDGKRNFKKRTILQ